MESDHNVPEVHIRLAQPFLPSKLPCKRPCADHEGHLELLSGMSMTQIKIVLEKRNGRSNRLKLEELFIYLTNSEYAKLTYLSNSAGSRSAVLKVNMPLVHHPHGLAGLKLSCLELTKKHKVKVNQSFYFPNCFTLSCRKKISFSKQTRAE